MLREEVCTIALLVQFFIQISKLLHTQETKAGSYIIKNSDGEEWGMKRFTWHHTYIFFHNRNIDPAATKAP